MSSKRFNRGAVLAFVAALWSVPRALEAQPGAPTLDYATYLGSNLDDSIVGLETDITGMLHVFGSVPAGATVSFPSLPAPIRFHETTPRPAGSRDCYLVQRFPGLVGDPQYSYVALISDLESCDAMTVGPGGVVYTAGRMQGGTRIDAYSLAAGSDGAFRVTRLFELLVREIEAVVQLRVDSAHSIHAVGRCAQDPSLWPLEESAQPPSIVGAQSSPDAGLCGGGSSDESQYLLFVLAVQPTPVLFRTFLGRNTATFDVTAMEIGSNGKVYLAGRTDAGLPETRNAYQPDPGDTGCTEDCGAGDAFLMVIDPTVTGSASLSYASYFGGSHDERDVAMALGFGDRVYLAGNTKSRATFPGATFADDAIFLSILDVTQVPSAQLVSSRALIESSLTTLLASSHTSSAMRLLSVGPIVLLANSTDPAFPLLHPLYSAPYDPAAPNAIRPLLLVYDIDWGSFAFATYLDDVQLARSAHVAAHPSGLLQVAVQTSEAGRSIDGSVPLGGNDVLLFGITDVPLEAPDFTPPVVSAPNPIVVSATEAGGARAAASSRLQSFLAGGTAVDDRGAPTRLAPQVVMNGTTVDATASTLFPVNATTTVTFRYRDAAGNVGQASSTVMVNTAGSVTTGGVPVTALNPSGASTPITVTFAVVNAPGDLTAGVVTNPPDPPTDFFFLTRTYNVVTTALYEAPIEVCFEGWGYITADRLLQVENNVWVDRTSDAASSGTSKCGRTSSLSPVVVVRPTAAVVPTLGTTSIPPPIAVRASAQTQYEPHVSGDLVTYNEGFAPGQIHYYRLSTGMDAAVPTGESFADFVTDVSGERMTFSRALLDRNAVMVFDASAGLLREVDGHPGSSRQSSAIGGDTVAFLDFSVDAGNVMAFDLSAANAMSEGVGTEPGVEQYPQIASDGRTIVWELCTITLINCDVKKASRTSGTWSATPVASSLDPESRPDTDGTWIVYGADRRRNATGADIHVQPVGGGPETRLAISGFQQNPSISNGVIAFESGATATATMDLFVYDIDTNLLYQVTATPDVSELANDISVLDDGDVRVVRIVWEAPVTPGGVTNIYTTTFSLGIGSQNQPPVLTLPANLTAEATSAAGANVAYSVIASDPEDGSLTAACTPVSGSLFQLASTMVTCSVTDSGGLTATDSFTIGVVDTTPPVVSAPAAITVLATEAGGVRSSSSPALAAFLSGGTAFDVVDAAPLRLAPQINGSDVDNATLFPIGQTITVSFRFRDASGNVGTRASNVTVVVGTPNVTARLVSSGTVAGTRQFVDIELVNGGTGHARQLEVHLVSLVRVRPKNGSSATLVSPVLPLRIGALDVGATTTVRLVLDVPKSIKELAITETGVFQNVTGSPGQFVQTQNWTP